MKILELYCGLGGWSKPWHDAGHDVTGVDITDFSRHFSGRFIKADILDWEPDQEYDIVMASPPCSEFSIIKKWRIGKQNESHGLDLVYRAFHLIEKIKPKYFVIENVRGLAEFLPPPEKIVKYNKHKDGKHAYLWGKFPDFNIQPDEINYRAFDTKKPRPIEQVRKSRGGGRLIGSKKPQLIATCKTSAERAKIPEPLAKKMMIAITSTRKCN